MIELKNCNKIYKNGNIGLENVSVIFPATGLIGIYGKSGSGKSTLLNCLGGLDKFTDGKIIFNQEECKSLEDYSTYIFQEYKLIEELSVIDNLKIAMPDAAMDNIDKLLERFNILHLKENKINAISGGQRQRVEVIRALLQDASILLCDEPDASLDDENKYKIFSALKDYSTDKLILVVSHNREFLKEYADAYITIEDGRITENTIKEAPEGIRGQKIKTKSLSLKNAFYLARNNLKKNKLKSAMTLIFLFLSLTMLSVLFTILSMNLSRLFYYALTENNIQHITLSPFDENKQYPQEISISSESAKEMNVDVISYESAIFKLNDGYGSFTIDCIWELENSVLEDTEVNDGEALISEGLFSFLQQRHEKVIGNTLTTGGVSIVIKGIVRDAIVQDSRIIMLNPNTVKAISGNLLVTDGICLVQTDGTIHTLPIYNPYKEEGGMELKDGRMPLAENEICLPVSLLTDYHLTGTNALNQRITLSLKGNDTLDVREFTIVGLTDSKIVLFAESLPELLALYGNHNLDIFLKRIILWNYDLQTLKKAEQANLCVVSDYTNDVLFVYYMLHGFLPILLALGIIFGIIAIFTILNNTNTSLIKNKKNIGVFISFKIKKKSIIKIYWIENCILGGLAIVLAGIGYSLTLFSLNQIIEKEWNLGFSFMHFNFWILFVLILFTLLAMLLGLMIPFKNLLKKNPIDILYDR